VIVIRIAGFPGGMWQIVINPPPLAEQTPGVSSSGSGPGSGVHSFARLWLLLMRSMVSLID